MNSKIIEKIKSDEILSKIIDKFDNEIYLVGGTVRDFYMGLESTDRDIIVMDEDARDFALKLSELFQATFVPLDEENKIYRIVLPDKINYIDVTNPVGDSIEKDLMRRDLTINAIAVNIRTGELIDISGGVTDIMNKCINYVNELNFVDDPLRLLRVYRFQALYGFQLAPETINAVCKYSDLIHKPAVERINYELLKLFGGDYAHIALENMNKTWILEEIFPFVKELKQVPPNSHHHLDLFHHSIETVKQVQILYNEAPDEVKEHLSRIDFGGFSRLAHLKLAAFMHDIGKFSTWTIEEGKHRFIKHDDVGSKMSVKILKDLHFSNKQIDYISSMIKYHIYPSHVMTSPQITEKIMMRYVRKMDTNSIDAIILAQADRLSARGPEITDQIVERNITSLNMLLRFYLEARETLKPLPKLLSGNDVMQILNIKPSKRLGEIMDALHEAQISGDVITKEHAIEFVKNMV
ncbi:polynucleotide adenylyltransferase/metal dependent phosphohydrolase [Clostridium sp. CAG:768]|nr:polynucleotide adenylyltransferase/metal dependent phosphohydrolase [Clostridium sp. CAG:768]